METPLKIWVANEVRARDEPYRRPFRAYFGITFLTIGISLLVYMANQ